MIIYTFSSRINCRNNGNLLIFNKKGKIVYNWCKSLNYFMEHEDVVYVTLQGANSLLDFYFAIS
jgi:hypothetical protein